MITYPPRVYLGLLWCLALVLNWFCIRIRRLSELCVSLLVTNEFEVIENERKINLSKDRVKIKCYDASTGEQHVIDMSQSSHHPIVIKYSMSSTCHRVATTPL